MVTNLLQKMGEDWTEFSVQPASFHDAGGVVAVEGRYRAHHKETGKRLDCQYCHV